MELRIECQGATEVDIDELHELHHFKTTKDSQYAHLRNSFTEFGFSFPFQIWIDNEGKKWIMDGHRRKPTLQRMREEGWVFGKLPASIVMAPDKKTAKKKLLAMESRYGSFDESGFTDFMNEEDSSLMDEDLSLFVEIPELNLDDSEPEKTPKEPKAFTCPNCQHVFTP